MKSLSPFNRTLHFGSLILAISLNAAWGAGLSAEDYLHQGASKYIQGRLQEASVEVDEGLRKFPNDSKLKALATQLKNMKDQKKQDQGGSGSQGGEDPKQKDQDKKEQDKQDQDKAKQDQKKADEDKKDQKDQDKEQAGKEEPPKKDQRDSSGQAPAPVKPGEMSKDEAERLLNSYQDDEKREHQEMQKRQKQSVDVEKDW